VSPGTSGPEFRGSVTGLAKQMIAAVLPIAAAVSFLLFGSLGGRIFLVSLAIVPVLLLFAWFIARVDRIRFDDTERVIRPTFRSPISYDRIERVRFVESLGVLQSIAHVGRRTELLTIGLDGEKGEDLQRALHQRTKGVEFDSRDYGAWKLTAIAVGVLIASSIAGSIYLERKAGATAAVCAAAPAPGAPSRAGDPIVREGQGIIVTLPRELETTKFTVARMDKFTETGRTGRIFLEVAGLRSEFELFHYAACARFGVVPRMLKGALLSRWETPRVFTFERDSVRILLVAGRRNETAEARILLYDEATNAEALVAVLLSAEFDATTLASLLPQFTITPGAGL
jgi:hypothetical protein